MLANPTREPSFRGFICTMTSIGGDDLMTIIDRLEGEWAIIELGDTTFQFPRALLPAEAKPGDVIFFRTEIDSKLTSDRKERIAQLESRLFRR